LGGKPERADATSEMYMWVRINIEMKINREGLAHVVWLEFVLLLIRDLGGTLMDMVTGLGLQEML
jgi:hypothetical protein